MILARSPAPIEIPLSSGNTVLFQIPLDHDPLWDNYASASPTTLVNDYLTESTKPKVSVGDLPMADLRLILSTALAREAHHEALDTNLAKDALCAQFLEVLLGISQLAYAKKRPGLLVELDAFCQKRIELIDQLVEKNRSELDQVSASQRLQPAREVRRERHKNNLRQLKIRRQFLQETLQHPDRTLGWEVMRETSKRRFTFLDDMTNCRDLDPDFLDYPYRWLGFLSTVVYEQLYRSWQKGNDIVAKLQEELLSAEFEDWLVNLVRQHDVIGRREALIREALWSFRSERYASTVTLLLPQIEGLLWELVEYIDLKRYPILTPHAGHSPRKSGFYVVDNFGRYMEKREPTVYCQNATEADRQKLDLAVDRKRKIREVDKVSVLLTETGLKYHLYRDLFEHLAGELLQERNAILHGEDVSFGTSEQATRKVLATAAVLDLFGYK